MNVMQALEIMKTHVVTVQRDSNLADAVDLMDLYQVDELPVVDEGGRLCGILRESEIALLVASRTSGSDENAAVSFAGIEDIAGLLVRDTMSHEMLKVMDTDEISTQIVRTMLTSARRIPVIDSNDRIVGTLNRVDIIQTLFEGTITPA